MMVGKERGLGPRCLCDAEGLGSGWSLSLGQVNLTGLQAGTGG